VTHSLIFSGRRRYTTTAEYALRVLTTTVPDTPTFLEGGMLAYSEGIPYHGCPTDMTVMPDGIPYHGCPTDMTVMPDVPESHRAHGAPHCELARDEGRRVFAKGL